MWSARSPYIEIADPGVSKGGALEWLCERLGVPRERTVACGDGHNDVDMLRWAGLGVAVAEAAPDVQAAADVVCRETSCRRCSGSRLAAQ